MGTDLHFDELGDRDRRADEDDEDGMQGEDEKQTKQEEGGEEDSSRAVWRGRRTWPFCCRV